MAVKLAISNHSPKFRYQIAALKRLRSVFPTKLRYVEEMTIIADDRILSSELNAMLHGIIRPVSSSDETIATR